MSSYELKENSNNCKRKALPILSKTLHGLDAVDHYFQLSKSSTKIQTESQRGLLKFSKPPSAVTSKWSGITSFLNTSSCACELWAGDTTASPEARPSIGRQLRVIALANWLGALRGEGAGTRGARQNPYGLRLLGWPTGSCSPQLLCKYDNLFRDDHNVFGYGCIGDLEFVSQRAIVIPCLLHQFARYTSPILVTMLQSTPSRHLLLTLGSCPNVNKRCPEKVAV